MAEMTQGSWQEVYGIAENAFSDLVEGDDYKPENKEEAFWEVFEEKARSYGFSVDEITRAMDRFA